MYASSAIVRESDSGLPAVIEPTAPACVGARLPHVWLDADGKQISTLDLTGLQPILITGPRGDAWRAASTTLRTAHVASLGVFTVGGAELRDPSGRALTQLGLEADGALLVRPDGHIAWRSRGAAARS